MINGSNIFDDNNNNHTEEIILTNKSKYPNLYEYESIIDNKNYLIFPIQTTNSYAFTECENNSKIYENLLEEIGLFNLYKEINYELSLNKEFSTSLYAFEASIDQKEFYNDLIYLLQGIPSSTFSLTEKFPFIFKLNENSNTNNLRFIGTLPGMTLNILQHFINFGSKMQLLQMIVKKYLFDVNFRNSTNISPFFENFFRDINEIFIKINEKILFYKKLILKENFTMMTLYNKIKDLSQIINVIYIIFNLNDQRYINQFKGNTFEEFFEFYNENNNFKKTNIFLDILLKVYFTFYNKDKIFFIIKYILLSSLHRYLYYIINLLFTGELIDENSEHFILLSNNDNISLDTKKIPHFLYEYKSLLLNNTILIKYIKKFDDNYYNMLAYNLKDFIEYIDNINIRNFSVYTLNNFKAFKKEVYEKKIKLMEIINKEVIYLQELKENEINIKNIEKIKEIKNYFIEYEKELMNKKNKIKEKKVKYYSELKEQILEKKSRNEEEIKKLKEEEIIQKEKERKEKENEIKFLNLMKLKLRQIQEKTKDIEIFGTLINKWIFQRNELNEKRKNIFEKLYGEINENNIDDNYPINKELEGNKKSYHKTIKEQLEIIQKEMDNQIIEEEQKDIQRALYNNSDNIKQIFNQTNENKKEENEKINKNETQKENNINNDKNEINIKSENNENNNENKEMNLKEPKNEEHNKNELNKNKNIGENNDKENKSSDNKNEKEKNNKLNNDNKNKYLVNINIFPEKEIQREEDTLYQLKTLIKTESEEKYNNDINYNNLNKKNEKQIPIQLIIKEFFIDIINKQNLITNQTFVLMLKNKFGLMHHFDFFNSIILCKKGDLILKYIESIFDFKTLTLNSSDHEFLTNELRALVKADYEKNIKSLYLNDLLESLKFKRITELNLNYAINNFELNFKLEYIATPPIDVIFNNSNSDIYDKIFKKLLKYNIYNQICVRIYQILKNIRNIKIDDISVDDKSMEDSNKDNNNAIISEKLIKLFNKSFRIFKGILSYIYQQIIEKTWNEMEQKIEGSIEVFQIIKYHHEAIKNIYNFLNNCPLILYFENLCNDLSQLYLQIIFSDFYDKQAEKFQFMGEIINKLKDDNNTIINYRNSLGEINPIFSVNFYL